MMSSRTIGSAVVAALCLASFAVAEPQLEPVDTSDKALGEGLSLRVFDLGRGVRRLPTLIEGQTANVNKTVAVPDLKDRDFELRDNFYAEVTGYLVIDEPGEYEFALDSDDGSEMYLGDKLAIGHDGLHDQEVAMEALLELEPGMYPLKLRMFEGSVNAAVRLRWRTPGSDQYVVVPASNLRTETDQVRVTSPGEKEFDVPDGPLASPRRPGDRRPLADVHPATRLVDLRPDGFEPKVGGIDFLPDGRMVMCLWEPEGRVLIVDGVTGDNVDRSKVEIKQIAQGLAEPLGIKVMEGADGKPRLFVLQKQELTELIDHDGDEVVDEYKVAVSGWPVSDNFHEFAFGLAEKNGKLYGSLALAIDPGGDTTDPQIPGRGTTLEMDPDAHTFRTVAAGLRTPNGIGIGEEGEIFITDNQGCWLPSSKVLRLSEGAFFGSHINPPNPLESEPVTPPVAWLPQGEIGNSPTNIVPVPDSWGPYAGQQFHGDVTHGGVKRVDVEHLANADGEEVWQACVFRFGQGLESGSNRLAVGPDDALYVGGIGSTGDWQQQGTKWYGLQKMAWTGEVPFEMLHVFPGETADGQGIEIEFTSPLASGSGVSPRSYRIRQWTYEPNEIYGGPKIDQREIDVESVEISSDRTKAYLRLSDDTPMREGYVIHVVLRDDGADAVLGEGDEKPWTTEGFYTLNVVPERDPSFDGNRTAAAPEGGFTPLFDGSSESLAANWHRYKGEGVGEQWQVEDGVLTLTAGGGGDLVTNETYENFDLRLDWNIAEGGNSGVFFGVAETGDHTGAPYQTGPEMQLLDDERHPDGKNGPDRLSGALYDLVDVPEPSPVQPAGQWNEARLWVEDGRVRQYLNGELVADVTIGSDDWRERLANSKFADWPRFATVSDGHLGLQDHGDVVRFRNIRVKRLGDE